MSWGVSKSIEDLLQRLQSNDPSLTSLHIFQGKKFCDEVIAILEGLLSLARLQQHSEIQILKT